MKKGKKKQQKEVPEPGTENRTGISREFAGEFAARLLEWYAVHKRNLPWRETTDPYRIWISEIILQQTRVAQGLEYYNRFTERFPDVASLAHASEDEVMNYWQGLGYYSRARNLHAAAKNIMERFGGVFPTDYRDVLSLKGVGEYTAAAICSFAYRAPYAVLDGNVYRILARILGIGMPADSPQAKKYFTAIAEELLDKDFPDDYNQAIMDFGAIQCVPQSPRCPVCPFTDRCAAFRENRVESLPVKKGKTAVKERFFNYFHIRCGGNILLHKRTGKDIWQNLYEFPLIETPGPATFAEIETLPEYRELIRETGRLKRLRSLPMPDHLLSHRIIHPVFHEMESLRLSPCSKQGEAAATAATITATDNVLGEAAATETTTAATGNVLEEAAATAATTSATSNILGEAAATATTAAATGNILEEPAATVVAATATGNVLEEAAATATTAAATGNVLGEAAPPEYATPSAATKYIVIPENKIKDYPVPRLIESYLEYTVGTLPL